MFCNMPKVNVAASWVYWMDAASGAVAPAGMMGTDPGLGGILTGVTNRAVYTAMGGVKAQEAQCTASEVG